MIKPETIGMIDTAKLNSVLTSTTDVKNYSFIEANDRIYVILQNIFGHDNRVQDVAIPAGEYLNGFDVAAWDGQVLVIDQTHITPLQDGGKNVAIKATDILTVDGAGLKVASAAPTSGLYFVVESITYLTGPAVKARVVVVDQDTTA